MGSLLPNDLLHMILKELQQQNDFNTLFTCICTGKQLAWPAVVNLYRIHHLMPFIEAGYEDVNCVRWASMWRSLILSGYGQTLFPYLEYIRVLDLRDLEDLHHDPRFSTTFNKVFSPQDLSEIKTARNSISKENRKLGWRGWLEVLGSLSSIGQVMISRSPQLDELVGHAGLDAFSDWIAQLPHLRHLRLWDGRALVGCGELIRQNCPFFKSLEIWAWQGDDADYQLSKFLTSLRPQSLEEFVIFGHSEAAAQTFKALDCHQESLKSLGLRSIHANAIPAISELQRCTQLVSFSLVDSGTTDLEDTHKGVFHETVDWLRGCKNLRNVSILSFPSALALMAPVCLENSIRLTKLDIDGITVRYVPGFPEALAKQTSLETLFLNCDTSLLVDDEVDLLVEAISKLVNLTDLRLREPSDNFSNRDIIKLASSLPKLEVWVTNGGGITDDVWPDISGLKHLRRMTFMALTSFTFEGIMDFIRRLGPNNEGLILMVMMQHPFWSLSMDHQSEICDAMSRTVGGNFELALAREADASSFSDSDSE